MDGWLDGLYGCLVYIQAYIVILKNVGMTLEQSDWSLCRIFEMPCNYFIAFMAIKHF